MASQQDSRTPMQKLVTVIEDIEVSTIQQMSLADINRQLAEDGVDVEGEVAKIKTAVLIMRAKAARANAVEKITRYKEILKQGLPVAPNWSIVQFKEWFMQQMSLTPELAPAYRNFQNASDEDWKSLADDLGILAALRKNDAPTGR